MANMTVVFDFDGTLHDSMHIYPTALSSALAWLAEEGYAVKHEVTYDEAKSYIGLTSDEMWSICAPELPTDVRDRAAALVGQEMDALIADGTARLFPGVPEMLDAVCALGLELVFLSNCRIAYQEVSRKAFGLDRWFCDYFNSESYGNIPKEEIFPDIKKRHAGPYAIVGDRYKDLAVASAYNLPSVGCLYGYGTPEELAGATLLAETPAEVARALERIVFGNMPEKD